MAVKRPGRPTKRVATATDLNTTGSLSDMAALLAKAFIKQSVEPNMLGYKPHAKQLLFHESTLKAKLYIGGNRSGKTTGGVVEDLWWVTKRHPYRELPPGEIRGRVIGVDFTTGTEQILLPQFKRWIVPSDLINGSWEDSWNNQDRTLNLANGSFLEFKSYDQELEKHAGTSRHFIHFDEEPPKQIFNENLLRLADTAGSWWITMTPVSGMTWVYDTLYAPEDRLQNLLIVKVHIDENPYVTEEGKLAAFAYMDDEERQARAEGSFVQKGGLVFKDFRDDHPFVIKNWMPPTTEWRVYESIDHGINHPTAIYWHAVHYDGRVVTFHEYYVSDAIVEDHARYIRDYRRQNNLTIFTTVGDPAMTQRNGVTGTSILQEYAKNGIYIATENITREIGIGLDKMISYLRIRNATNAPTWFITERCKNLIKEMKRYHWDTYDTSKATDRNPPKQVPKKKDDDAIDSCRYFFTQMPDLAPEPKDTPMKGFDPGTLLHTRWLMGQAPPDAHRPVEHNWAVSSPSYEQSFAGLEGDY